MFFLIQLVTLGCELAMVFGGVVPYIPQYWQIKQKQTTQVQISSWDLDKDHQLFNRASPFTSAWHYCWPTPSASSSGSASDLRPLSLFRFLGSFIKSNAPVTTQSDNLTTTYSLFHFLSPECPHECGDVCSHPPLRVHQQQGGCSTSFSSKPSVSWASNVL